MKTNKNYVNKELGADFSKIESQIDYSVYQKEKRKYNKIKTYKVIGRSLISISCVAILCVVLIPVLSFFKIDNSVKTVRVNYSLNEINKLKSDSFTSLNQVNYPNFDSSLETKQRYDVEQAYVQSVQSFTNKINAKMEVEDNVIYSPLSLYQNLDITSLLSNDAETILEYENLLGASSTIRNKNYDNMFKNNFYLSSKGTTQMYNGLFISNQNQFNNELLQTLTNHYVETYQMDYSKDTDIDLLLKWIDNKLDSTNMLKKEDLEIDDETIMTLLSTLYFNNKWSNKFVRSNTYTSTFYGSKVENKKTPFMTHSFTNCVYDYGDFITVEDNYSNYYTIRYILPKNSGVTLDNILKNYDITIDDSSKLMTSSNEMFSNDFIVKLSVPKFKTSYYQDFTDILKSLGLKKAFDERAHSFDYSFTDLSMDDSIYLKYVKQKNLISFDEDGTIAKTVTMSGFGKDVASQPLDTMVITLDHPFIYLIKDHNNLPLYVGAVNNL